MKKFKLVDKILDKTLACEILGISPRTLVRWIRAGKIPAVSCGQPEKEAGRVLISMKRIQELLDILKKPEKEKAELIEGWIEENQKWLNLETEEAEIREELERVEKKKLDFLKSTEDVPEGALERSLEATRILETQLRNHMEKKIREYFGLAPEDEVDLEAIRAGRQKEFLRLIIRGNDPIARSAMREKTQDKKKVSYRKRR